MHTSSELKTVKFSKKKIFEFLENRISELESECAQLKILSKEAGVLRNALVYSPSSIIITDLAGNIQYVNPKFERLTGYLRNEVIGENPRMLKSGKQSAKFYSGLWETILAGEVWRGEFHNKKKNGESYWEFASISSIRDSSDNIAGFIAIKEDVTKRKNIERERENLILDLIDQKKLANLGQLAAAAAHDLNNALSPFACLELLNVSDNDSESLVNFMSASYTNMKCLVKTMLNLAQKKTFELVIDDVSNHLEYAVRAGGLIAKSSTVEVKYDFESIEEFRAPHLALGDAFVNLIKNAVEHTASNETGMVNVRLYRPANGYHCCVEIEDNGEGISKDDLDHIFEPFFTKKIGRKGNGLGLSSAYSCITGCGGRLDVESELGLGTKFSVYLSDCVE